MGFDQLLKAYIKHIEKVKFSTHPPLIFQHAHSTMWFIILKCISQAPVIKWFTYRKKGNNQHTLSYNSYFYCLIDVGMNDWDIAL